MSHEDWTHRKCLKCGAELTSLSAHNCGQCGANQHELAKEREAAKLLTETLKLKVAQEHVFTENPQNLAETVASYKHRSVKQGQTALLLCVTLGMVGAHRFYVGKFTTALLMALAPIPTVIAVITILVRLGQDQLPSAIAFSLALMLLVYAAVGTVVLHDIIQISSAKFKDNTGKPLIF